MMKPTIKKVESKKELGKFIDFQYDLYKDDPNYVPPLFLAEMDLLNQKKHPFFHHSKADYFLAYSPDGKIVGRIAAIRNNNHLKYVKDNSGFFGFFDVIEDYDVAEALLQKAVDWVKNEGLGSIQGPSNFSTNETVGTLIEGFDRPPYIQMTHNFPYYKDFIEKFGFKKKVDLFAWEIFTKNFPERLIRAKNILEEKFKRSGITIRNINMKDFKKETQRILKVYNESWKDNEGFVPMTEAEFETVTKEMKPIVDPDLILIAEKDGEMVGVSLAVPDINQIFMKIKRGRLLPFGIFKLLFGQKKINRARVIAMGIIPKYRKLGIDAYFYTRSFELAGEKNMVSGEASWILENNPAMNHAAEKMNGILHKKYRIFEMDI